VALLDAGVADGGEDRQVLLEEVHLPAEVLGHAPRARQRRRELLGQLVERPPHDVQLLADLLRIQLLEGAWDATQREEENDLDAPGLFPGLDPGILRWEPTVHPGLCLVVEGQHGGPQLVVGLLAGHQRLQQGELTEVLLQETLLLVDVLRRAGVTVLEMELCCQK